MGKSGAEMLLRPISVAVCQ